MNRPYVPELRSIPLTFMDCPKRWDCNPRYYDLASCSAGSALVLCDWRRLEGHCPRGFQ